MISSQVHVNLPAFGADDGPCLRPSGGSSQRI